MRNLIPRLQVVVARDKSRAERVLGTLTPGLELFLAPLTEELMKVSAHTNAEGAFLLGILPREWSARIQATEASGRQCRAWFVEDLPPERSPDGTFRAVLTIWCSSRSSQPGWRNLSVDELLSAARAAPDVEPPMRVMDSPFRKSRLFELPIAQEPGRHVLPAQRTVAPKDAQGLSSAQLDLIRDAVRRRLAARND